MTNLKTVESFGEDFNFLETQNELGEFIYECDQTNFGLYSHPTYKDLLIEVKDWNIDKFIQHCEEPDAFSGMMVTLYKNNCDKLFSFGVIADYWEQLIVDLPWWETVFIKTKESYTQVKINKLFELLKQMSK